MKAILMTLGLVLSCATLADEGNPMIDYAGFVGMTADLEKVRAERRIPEDEFLRMAREKGTVVLDVRSREKYDKLHVAGALHLNFSDFTEETLAELIPDKSTRILIYCNNNFDGEPALFPGKSARVALNIPTFINLYAYGYRNVYELKPFTSVRKTAIPFEGTSVLKKDGR